MAGALVRRYLVQLGLMGWQIGLFNQTPICRTNSNATVFKEKDSEMCKKSWRLVLEEKQRNLATLAETTESYRKTIAHLLKQLD
ncbi:MAG: hypothetical protein IIA70_04935 [Proteobacteria bacterium]|nr:hypothetical protein [Pseudomonadota bacterium]